jgi:hypothetical protein
MTNDKDSVVTQADNDLLVKITEWLIREDAIDEENQRQLNRLGDFLEPRLARHRIASSQPTQTDALKKARDAIRGLLDITSEYNLDSEQAGRAYAALHTIDTALKETT